LGGTLEELQQREAFLQDMLARFAEELSWCKKARAALEEIINSRPKHLSPSPEMLELLERARTEFTAEEVNARVEKLKAEGGREIHEFIGDLEKAAH
jgi:hypothetical protein